MASLAVFLRALGGAAALLALAATAAPADRIAAGDLVIEDAWTRATPPRAPNGGAFLTIRNRGGSDDRLLSASTPAAARAELHTHTMSDGVMRMRPVTAIDVPAGGVVELKPGGLHVMMLGLNEPLVEGTAITIELTFEKAGPVSVTVPVFKAGAQAPTEKPMEPPRDPAPHGSPMITPGGHMIRP